MNIVVYAITWEPNFVQDMTIERRTPWYPEWYNEGNFPNVTIISESA